jgi:hypothetical protein
VFGELEKCERVAAGRADEVVKVGWSQSVPDESERRRAVEPGQLHDVEAGVQERCGFVSPDGRHDQHRVGDQSTCGEDDRLRRGSVQQMSVVDEHGAGDGLGQPAQHSQRGRPHREAVDSRAGADRQCHTERVRLRFRQLVEIADGPGEQLGKSAERQVALHLRPDDPVHDHPVAQ